MMKKYIKYAVGAVIIILVVIIICFFIVADSENKKSNSKLCTLTEVKSELDNYTFSEHDNLTFCCEIPEIEAEKLYAITMKAPSPPTDETETNLRKLMSLITSLDFSDVSADLMMNEVTNEPYSVVLNYDETKVALFGELYENSNTFLCRNIYCDDIDYGTPDKVVDISNKSDMNDEIELISGDTLNISQADNYISETLQVIADNGFFNKNESFRLKNALVENNENSHDIVLRYEHILEGLPVDIAGFVDPYGENGEIRPSYIDAIVTGESEFLYLCNKYYYEPKVYDNIEKILPLSKAEEIASKGLAPNLKYEVSETDLKYCCYSKDTNREFIYKPMWYFLIEEKNGQNISNYFPCISVYVDAVSGDMYYCDSAAMRLDIVEYK